MCHCNSGNYRNTSLFFWEAELSLPCGSERWAAGLSFPPDLEIFAFAACLLVAWSLFAVKIALLVEEEAAAACGGGGLERISSAGMFDELL
jgi:hypothetical protein